MKKLDKLLNEAAGPGLTLTKIIADVRSAANDCEKEMRSAKNPDVGFLATDLHDRLDTAVNQLKNF